MGVSAQLTRFRPEAGQHHRYGSPDAVPAHAFPGGRTNELDRGHVSSG